MTQVFPFVLDIRELHLSKLSIEKSKVKAKLQDEKLRKPAVLFLCYLFGFYPLPSSDVRRPRRKEDFSPNYKGLTSFLCSQNAPVNLLFEFFPDDCQIGIGCGIFVLLPEINVKY